MEAVPTLWDNWDDFLARNDAMIAALAVPAPATLDETRPWLRSIGAACAACHEDYRE
jgi:cytochrome c556